MTKGTNNNRLVGWLVSYASEDLGSAYELRSGRTLVGRNPAREGRVIEIDDKSLSNPHSAFAANTKHEVRVQDIFSDGGTFIQRAESSQELKVEGPTELYHGDWVRFGAADRYQVCLIDAPKR